MKHSTARFFPVLSALAALSLALGLGACGDSDTGTVRVQLTDAPFPFEMLESATVDINAVKVHVISDPGDEGEWETISTEEQTIDLLDLQNGITHILGEAEVPHGFIDQIRLMVDEARVVLDDGREFRLRVPSGEQSGIKIHVEPFIEVHGGDLTDLLLDFDVSRSFHPVPASANHSADIREFHFRPSIRAANLSTTGSISGRVVDDMDTPADPDDDVPIEDAAVTCFKNGDEIANTATDSDGEFVLLGLPAGGVTLAANAPGFAQGELDVTVVAGSDAGGNIIRLHRN
jgi:uncharacterized protein DUF4382/carboxypeptidase family protein